MEKRFNLLDEPWIPCSDLQGEQQLLGIRNILIRAHEFKEIRDNSPLVTASIHRLLLAVLHRALDGPQDRKHWLGLWGRGQWDATTLTAYFERWRERFFLIHPQDPFFQVARFTIIGKDGPTEPASTTKLKHELATGNNPTLFDHSNENSKEAISCDEAARRIVATQYFGIGGGKGGTSNLFSEHPYLGHAPLVNGVFTLLTGPTLFHTFMLNLLVPQLRGFADSAEDKPVWENNAFPPPGDRSPLGYLDYLTFQARCMRLVEQDGKIHGVYMAQGHALAADFQNPSSPYRLTKEGAQIAVNLNPVKAFWRDSYSLYARYQEPGMQYDGRPAALRQVANLSDHISSLGSILNCWVLGVANDKAKVLFWRHEEMPVPVNLLTDEEMQGKLIFALEECEKGGRCLDAAFERMAEWVISPEDAHKANKDNRKVLHNNLRNRSPFWESMELPFYRFLRHLPQDQEMAYSDWIRTVKLNAHKAYQQAAPGIQGKSARELKAHAMGESYLSYLLKKELIEIQPEGDDNEGTA